MLHSISRYSGGSTEGSAETAFGFKLCRFLLEFLEKLGEWIELNVPQQILTLDPKIMDLP